MQITRQKASELFRKHGGVLRTAEAIALGINPKTLYAMRDDGLLQLVDRGIYLLVDNAVSLENIDLLIAYKRLPRCVFCLISALAFHGLTTQIPRYVYVAYQQGWRGPQVHYPPIRVFRYSASSFSEGVEFHEINGLKVPVFSPAKTVVDCFKFRSKVGLDVAIEALQDYWQKNKSATTDELFKYAKICRVSHLIEPYINVMTSG